MKLKQDGFTLIEMLLAITAFSVVLLLVAAGTIHLIKLYRSGLALRNTQQVARAGIDDMVRIAREAYEIVTPDNAGTPAASICLSLKGSKVKYYIESGILYRRQLAEGLSDCSHTSNDLVTALTTSGTTVSALSATKSSGNPPTLEISFNVASADGTNSTAISSAASLRGVK